MMPSPTTPTVPFSLRAFIPENSVGGNRERTLGPLH
jgi:hypothetical protein